MPSHSCYKACFNRKKTEFQALKRRRPNGKKLSRLLTVMQECVDVGLFHGYVWALDAQAWLNEERNNNGVK
jgi:hypothetical protein